MAYNCHNFRNGDVLTADQLNEIEQGISGKLDASELSEAVNGALAQAKASGEFDGTSVTVDFVRESTEDGDCNVVTFSNGQTLTVMNGSKGSTGSAGKNGVDGKTPIKGTDYFTEADKEEIVQQVITALGTPVFGRVDADNNIILTGELADGTYTIKYENAEGNVTDVGTIDTRPGYTNMLLLAVEADDTPYNGGQGWKTDTRLSSSGDESTSSATGMEVTGFIPFTRGDVIRFSGITMNGNSSNASRCYFIQYDSNKTMLTQWIVTAFNTHIENGYVLVDADGNILQINTGNIPTDGSYPINANAAYFRISADEINADSVITLNQEID